MVAGRLARGALLVACVVCVKPAWARDHFDDEPFHVEGRLGAATTVGVLGAVLEYNLADYVAVGIGGGVNTFGAIWDAHARFRPLVGATRSGHSLHALTLEAGLSYGRYTGEMEDFLPPMSDNECGRTCATTRIPQWIPWAQFEVGWEARFPGHLTLRTTLGVAKAVSSPTWSCEFEGQPEPCPTQAWESALFVQSIALGYAF